MLWHARLPRSDHVRVPDRRYGVRKSSTAKKRTLGRDWPWARGGTRNAARSATVANKRRRWRHGFMIGWLADISGVLNENELKGI